MSRDAQKLLGDLTEYEQELKRIQKDAADRDRLEKDIRVKYAKVKAAYDKQKVDYEAALQGADERAGAEARRGREKDRGHRSRSCWPSTVPSSSTAPALSPSCTATSAAAAT